MNRAEKALAVVSGLTTAGTVAKAVDLFQQALEPFGVKVFRTCALANPARPYLMDAVVSNWSQEWTEFYFGRRLFLYDPTLRAARSSNEGFFWRDVPPADSREARELMQEALSIGLTEGFVAVRQMPGELKTAVSVGGAGLDWTVLEQGVVSLLANTLMARVLYLRDISLAPAVQPLSDREAQVLHHAAAGQGDKEIAQALEISFTTVRYHWSSIHRKLGTVDRAHAVAIGLWSGQIAP